jgi:hypothetical protein
MSNQKVNAAKRSAAATDDDDTAAQQQLLADAYDRQLERVSRVKDVFGESRDEVSGQFAPMPIPTLYEPGLLQGHSSGYESDFHIGCTFRWGTSAAPYAMYLSLVDGHAMFGDDKLRVSKVMSAGPCVVLCRMTTRLRTGLKWVQLRVCADAELKLKRSGILSDDDDE